MIFKETDQADTVVFTTEVKGIPRPVVTWLLDDQELQESDTVTIQHRNTLTSITIRNIQSPLEGRITAIARNDLGTATTSTEICYVPEETEPFSTKDQLVPVESVDVTTVTSEAQIGETLETQGSESIAQPAEAAPKDKSSELATNSDTKPVSFDSSETVVVEKAPEAAVEATMVTELVKPQEVVTLEDSLLETNTVVRRDEMTTETLAETISTFESPEPTTEEPKITELSETELEVREDIKEKRRNQL